MRKAEVAATAALRVNTVAKRMAVELRVQKEWRGGGGERAREKGLEQKIGRAHV